MAERALFEREALIILELAKYGFASVNRFEIDSPKLNPAAMAGKQIL